MWLSLVKARLVRARKCSSFMHLQKQMCTYQIHPKTWERKKNSLSPAITHINSCKTNYNYIALSCEWCIFLGMHNGVILHER